MSADATQQIVGRERRERVSHHNWSGDAFVNSRRRVNSTVMPHRFENLAVWLPFTRRAEVATSRATSDVSREIRIDRRALCTAMRGRRDPLWRGITSRWTGAREACFAT